MKELKEIYKEPLYDHVAQRVELPRTFKIISCPNCSTEVPADNLSISDKIGKCGSCQAVFSIEKDIRGLQQHKEKINQEILRPEGIEMFEFKDELEISFEQPVTWLEWTAFILVTIFWFPGIGVSMEKGTIIPFMIFAAIPTIVGILYYLRKKKKHRKYILIDDQYLSIVWQPKMFNSNRDFAVTDISQLYVKHNPNMGDWQLKMIIDEGQGHKHIKLTSVNTVSKAKYLEQVIEQQLGIQDVVVPEEA